MKVGISRISDRYSKTQRLQKEKHAGMYSEHARQRNRPIECHCQVFLNVTLLMEPVASGVPGHPGELWCDQVLLLRKKTPRKRV